MAHPTLHRLAIVVSLILMLSLAVPELAAGKHRKRKLSKSTAGLVGGFGYPGAVSPVSSAPTSFTCELAQDPTYHDYVCTPSPLSLDRPWPTAFRLSHALFANGNPPENPPPVEWGGLATPEIAAEFSCQWDQTEVPLPFDDNPAFHYDCSYQNPQHHPFTIADIVSVCEEDPLSGDCFVPPGPVPEYREIAPDTPDPEETLDTWYLPDTLAPDTAVVAGPRGTVSSRAATLQFGSSENGSTFACQLDGGQWKECGTPLPYAGLGDGSHTFAVRATDNGGNPDPTAAAWTWSVDATAPETAIIGGPAATTRDRTPTFSFLANDLIAAFECRFSGRPFGPCGSPHTATRPLAYGRHSFDVRASDSVGNVESSPARRSFAVDTRGPRMRIAGRRIKLGRGGRARVRIGCPLAELSPPCAGRLVLRTRKGSRIGRRPFTVPGGERVVLGVRVSRRARDVVSENGRLRVRAIARARDQLGNRKTTARKLVLRAPVG